MSAENHQPLAEQIRELFSLFQTLNFCHERPESECSRHQFSETFRLEQLGEYRIVLERGRGGVFGRRRRARLICRWHRINRPRDATLDDWP